MSGGLTEMEKRIMSALAGGLAPVERPYLEVARAVGWSEGEVIEALRSLAARGILRRAAAIVSPEALGAAGAALVAWRVPPGDLEKTALELSQKSFITHCVARKSHPEWPYNLYTMVHGKDALWVRGAVRAIADEEGIAEYVVLETRGRLKSAPPVYRFEDGGTGME